MNSLNSFSVDVEVGTAIAVAEKKEEVGTCGSGGDRAGVGLLAIGVALGLTDGGVIIFGLEGAELLERKYHGELLADPIRLAAASLLTTL